MLTQAAYLSAKMEIERRERENRPGEIEAEWRDMEIQSITSSSAHQMSANVNPLPMSIQVAMCKVDQLAKRLGISLRDLQHVASLETEDNC